MTSATEPLFSALPLSAGTLATLTQLGYDTMTPIQAASLPVALAGEDLIAQARTGSGKTAAFALALLHRLDTRRFDVQALVMCPTRELADQVTQEIRRLARAEENVKVLTLCGGSPMRPQVDSLIHGAHVVVGTPGRLMDHIERGSLDMRAINTLVLDEADRMLDMGFVDDIAYVARHCPKERQTMLFSATYPPGIEKLAQQFMRKPRQIKVAEQHAPDKIRQRFYEVEDGQRLNTVARLLEHYRPVSTLAFCNTKARCRDLVDLLRAQGYQALALHGELDQRDRDQVLVQFANRSCSILVATDVAARGLDIAQLEAVINVDVTPDPEVHVHRVGRTGRADAEGWAFTLVSMNEMGRVGNLEQHHGGEFEWHAAAELLPTGTDRLLPPMVTLQMLGGRKEKYRPGDLLGALTGDAGFAKEQIGKINVMEMSTYIAVDRAIGREAVRKLNEVKVKGRKVKVRMLTE